MESNLEMTFENIVCQMVDIFKPINNIQFTLEDFYKRKLDFSSTIYFFLIDLEIKLRVSFNSNFRA